MICDALGKTGASIFFVYAEQILNGDNSKKALDNRLHKRYNTNASRTADTAKFRRQSLDHIMTISNFPDHILRPYTRTDYMDTRAHESMVNADFPDRKALKKLKSTEKT